MGRAKDIIIKPIAAKDANRIIKQLHYSGKVVQNSQLHFGVFLDGRCGGAMQLGPSLDKRKLVGLVEGTLWNEFIELNRMAFADWLPRNSESRAISVVMRILRKRYPHIKWVLSFADACQCGDGTIYRASGFVLTNIQENKQIYKLPRPQQIDVQNLLDNGLTASEIDNLKLWLRQITHCHVLSVQDRPPKKMSLEGAPHAHVMSLEDGERPNRLLSEVKKIMRKVTNGGTSARRLFVLIGGEREEGHQLRYIYFLDPSYRERLTVPEIPYSRIGEMGIGMYKGEKRTPTGGASEPTEAGGSMPTRPLQTATVA